MIALVLGMMGCSGNTEVEEGPATVTASEATPIKDSSKVVVAPAVSIDECEVCDNSETHRIDFDYAAELIQNFDNTFIKTQLVSNAGGVINFDISKLNKDINSYETVKFHFGFNKSQKKLSLTAEASNKKCVEGKYEGTPGVEDALLFGTHIANDFVLKSNASNDLKKSAIINHFIDGKPYRVNDKTCKVISKKDASDLLVAFNNENIRTQYYPECLDAVFNKVHTIDEIEPISKTKIYRYYFGLDLRENIKRRLRVILVGMDSNDKLVTYDDSDNLMLRETSRPHP